MLDEDGGGTITPHELIHALRHNAEAFELAQGIAGLQSLFELAKQQRDADKKRKRIERKNSGVGGAGMHGLGKFKLAAKNVALMAMLKKKRLIKAAFKPVKIL